MFKCKDKECKAVEEPKTEAKQFKVSEVAHEYIFKSMEFSDKFLIEAIREKAAREGVLIPQTATASWWGLIRDRHSSIERIEYTPRANIEWKDPIQRCCMVQNEK